MHSPVQQPNQSSRKPARPTLACAARPRRRKAPPAGPRCPPRARPAAPPSTRRRRSRRRRRPRPRPRSLLPRRRRRRCPAWPGGCRAAGPPPACRARCLQTRTMRVAAAFRGVCGTHLGAAPRNAVPRRLSRPRRTHPRWGGGPEPPAAWRPAGRGRKRGKTPAAPPGAPRTRARGQACARLQGWSGERGGRRWGGTAVAQGA
jgi:hypothetical protein